MSWSLSREIDADANEFDAIDDWMAEVPQNFPTDESRAQCLAAAEAARSLIGATTRAGDRVSVSLSGHTTPGLEHSCSVHVSLRQILVPPPTDE